MTEEQLILQQCDIQVSDETLDTYKTLLHNGIEAFDDVSLEDTVRIADICNALYRAGIPIASDEMYDNLIQRIAECDPNHPYLQQVEPEPDLGKVVPLPKPMLSTKKTYSVKEVAAWLDNVQKAADALGIPAYTIKVSPKLDGWACYDDRTALYTRGDGLNGTLITHVLDRGVCVVGDRYQAGPGELVVSKSYFEQHLSDTFSNTRNFQGAVIKSSKLDPIVQKACDEGAMVFYPFHLLPTWEGAPADLLDQFDTIVKHTWDSVDYDVDGIVLEVTNDAIKESLGSARQYHHWQLAFKINATFVDAKVIKVVPQTGKTGCITPVAILEPTEISGATVQRVTAHNYGHVKKWGLGKGSIISLVRAGLVIPKIHSIVKPSDHVVIPDRCPSCRAPVGWENDRLYCSNTINCPAQIERRLLYFFETLGNLDGFGPSTIETLCANGIRTLAGVYLLTTKDLKRMGFGDKQSQNLIGELKQSLLRPIPDWRFLAAFGIPNIGKGGCELLLKHYPLLKVFYLTKEQIQAIKGFGEISAETLVNTLKAIHFEFRTLYDYHFTLTTTPLADDGIVLNSPIKDKSIVFTGTMYESTREHLQEKAKQLGARVSNSVSSKTDYLVVGDKPGSNKLKDAERYDTEILDEDDYLSLLKQEGPKVSPHAYKKQLVAFIKAGGWVGQNANYYYPNNPSLKKQAKALEGISPTTCLSGIAQALIDVPDLWEIASANADKDPVSKRHPCDHGSFIFGMRCMQEEEEHGLLKPMR